jgi:hypothetical protein
MRRFKTIAAALALFAGASGRAEADYLYYAVNAGGAAAGGYAADGYWTGSAFPDATTNQPIDTSQVTDPAPQEVYQTGRIGDGLKQGNFDYIFPSLTPGQSYDVRLDFAEVFWDRPGLRVFDVAINGASVLTNFDIVLEAGGKDVAIARTFSVLADPSGVIDVKFTTVTDAAKVSGLSVRGAAPASTPEPSSFALTGLALAALAAARARGRR